MPTIRESLIMYDTAEPKYGWVCQSFFFFCALSLMGGKCAFGEGEVWLACVDCYGPASLYPVEARKLFPNKKIKWIHIQTDRPIPAFYRGSFDATKDEYEGRLVVVDLNDNATYREIIRTLKQQGVVAAFGGMESGALAADQINASLDVPFGNDPSTSRVRREKYPMQQATPERYRIPSILTDDVEKIVHFAKTLNASEVVIKPNKSSGADFVQVLKNKPETIRIAAHSLLGQTDKYGHLINAVVVQPAIDGTEYAANSIAKDGVATLVSVWRYEKLRMGARKVSFLYRPFDLRSPVARELQIAVQDIHTALLNRNGPGHTELMQEAGTGKWYFIEQGARIGGRAMPLIDAQVWGTSHLHLNLVRVLDPVEYDRIIKSFPKKHVNDGAIISLLSPLNGRLKEGASEKIGGLPTYFLPAPFYRIVDGKTVSKAIDLSSVAATVNLVGPTTEVKQDAETVIRWATGNQLLEYDPPGGLAEACAFALSKIGNHWRQLGQFKKILW
ncbi:MAG: ATP-grasp domain-containing protein [Deltaproteobacteria bacterium]|nr:ATP-grasp domain-containing protein [Deltaproteobacteria bacterium]